MITVQNRVQEVINRFDQGFGLNLIRTILFSFFIGAVLAFYVFSQFRGLRDSEAMEYAELARNMADGKGLITRCIRPADLWQVKNIAGGKYDPGSQPDIRHPPLFPAILSICFMAVRPSSETPTDLSVFVPEKTVIMPVCMFFSLATGVLLYLTGKRLFGPGVGVVSVLVYFLTDAVLVHSISGTPVSLVMFLTTGAFYTALVASAGISGSRTAISWLIPFLASALFCALAFLAAYPMAVLAPVLAVFLSKRFMRWQWTAALAFLFVFLALISPWLIRNREVSGSVAGVTLNSMLAGPTFHEDGSLDRSLAHEFDPVRTIQALKIKLMSNLPTVYDLKLRTIGNGLVVCFFLVSFFSRFDGEEVNVFRWCLAATVILLLVLNALCSEGSGKSLDALLPMVVLYGTAFFFVMMTRVEYLEPSGQTAMIWAFVILAAIPAVLKMTGKRAEIPYPPYYPPFVSYVCRLLEPDETLCTDIPWATAWYGNRTSVLLPRSVDDFYEINESVVRLSGLYLAAGPGSTPRDNARAAARDRSWLPIMNGMIPSDFPLTHGFELPPGSHDQLFLTDRIRWREKTESDLAESGANVKIRPSEPE